MRDQEGKSKGFGFICFKDPECAFNAYCSLNGKNGLYVSKALKKDEREQEIRRLTEKFKK